LVNLKGKELKKEEIFIPPIKASFPKVAYVIHSKDMIDVPTQDLAIMSINTLEQDDNTVKNCSEKGKVVEGEELLPQLTIHTMKKTSAKTSFQN